MPVSDFMQRTASGDGVPKSTKVHLSRSDQETVSGSGALSRMPTALVVLFGLFGLGFGVGYAVRKRRSRMRRRSYYHNDGSGRPSISETPWNTPNSQKPPTTGDSCNRPRT